MSEKQQHLGGRLPLTDPATLTAAQRRLYDTVFRTRVSWADQAGIRVTTSDDRLIGPFNAFLLRPEVAEAFLALRAASTEHTTLSDREREIVIVSVGAVWGAEYELYAHTALARQAGLSDSDATSLRRGDTPESLDHRERLAAELARQLSSVHRVSDELYREAEKAFSATGLFDIVALVGQYQTVCSLLNLFDVPAPK